MRLLTCFLQLLAGLALPAVPSQVRPPTPTPAWLPWSSRPLHSKKSQTHSRKRRLQGCPYISQESGWTMQSGRRPQAGLSQTSALGSVLVGAGKPQKRREVSCLAPGATVALLKASLY